MSAMQAKKVFQLLGATESELVTAIDSLTRAGFSDGLWPEALRKAAATLQSIQLDTCVGTERNRLKELLQQLAGRARTASTLLDTAAALYFGRVLSSCSRECGYLVDGGANKIHYGCIRIEG